jgi:hypothetical protein
MPGFAIAIEGSWSESERDPKSFLRLVAETLEQQEFLKNA